MSPFVSEPLPPHYAPFNVQAVGSDVVVTYVLTRKGPSLKPTAQGLPGSTFSVRRGASCGG